MKDIEKIVIMGKFTGLTLNELFNIRSNIENDWIQAESKYQQQIEEIDEAIKSLR